MVAKIIEVQTRRTAEIINVVREFIVPNPLARCRPIGDRSDLIGTRIDLIVGFHPMHHLPIKINVIGNRQTTNPDAISRLVEDDFLPLCVRNVLIIRIARRDDKQRHFDFITRFIACFGQISIDFVDIIRCRHGAKPTGAVRKTVVENVPAFAVQIVQLGPRHDARHVATVVVDARSARRVPRNARAKRHRIAATVGERQTAVSGSVARHKTALQSG